MIKEFVEIFMNKKDHLRKVFEEKHPSDYIDIVKTVVKLLNENLSCYEKPDPDRIHEINDGDYQGTLVYIIGAQGYQPSDYWATKVYYGSCSGCDTLEGIREYSEDKPSEQQVEDYLTLCLHLIQQMKEI